MTLWLFAYKQSFSHLHALSSSARLKTVAANIAKLHSDHPLYVYFTNFNFRSVEDLETFIAQYKYTISASDCLL